jgi:hypothetical protein
LARLLRESNLDEKDYKKYMVEDGTVIGYMYVATITTVYYLSERAVGAPRAQEEIKKMLSLLNRLLLTDLFSNRL